MPRKSEPRYWADRKLWYAMVNRKRHVLARGKEEETRAEAHQRFGQLLDRLKEQKRNPNPILEPGKVAGITVVCRAFLEWAKVNRSEKTALAYRIHCQAFTDHLVRLHTVLAADDVTPSMATTYVDRPNWGDTSRRNVVVALKTMFSWAYQAELIEANPLARLKAPKAKVREFVPTEAEFAPLLHHESVPLLIRESLLVLWETGARPRDIFELEARHVTFLDAERCGEWEMPGKTSGKTGRKDRVMFGQVSYPILKKLVGRHPEGKLFRSARGAKWNPSRYYGKIAEMRERLGVPDYATPKTLRHLFATRAQLRGEPSAVIQVLMNHSSSQYIDATYGRLAREREHLRAAFNRIHRITSAPADDGPKD